MRVLQVHNQYCSGLGGEDTVVRLEEELLRGRGHEVRQLIVSTSELKGAGSLRLLRAAQSSVWSRSGYDAVAKAVKGFQPDVVHVHNTFPLLSPSVYYAARQNGACVVQTLHNYRIACTNGLLLRNGVPCEDCVGRAKWRGLAHRCYDHGSIGLSGLTVAIQTSHRIAGTFRQEVDAYIALTSFQRDIVIRDGLPSERVHVKPNFTPVITSANNRSERAAQVVFVGSMVRAKGVDLLLDAWTRIRPDGYRLLLLGDGLDRAELQQRYARDESVIWMGFQSPAEVARLLAESKYLAICSRLYETFGMVLLEAFSAGTPVIAPNHAAFPEILAGGCGFLFEPSNLDSLGRALRRAVSTEESEWRKQSDAALARAGDYSADANYLRLMDIYASAREHYGQTR